MSHYCLSFKFSLFFLAFKFKDAYFHFIPKCTSAIFILLKKWSNLYRILKRFFFLNKFWIIFSFSCWYIFNSFLWYTAVFSQSCSFLSADTNVWLGMSRYLLKQSDDRPVDIWRQKLREAGESSRLSCV